MSRAAVEQLLFAMDQAFGVDLVGQQELLLNLGSVHDDDEWLWVPPGGGRNIRQIVGHIGACKYQSDNRAFSNGMISGSVRAGDLGCTMDELVSNPTLNPEPSRQAVIDWMIEGHRRWREHVAALDDTDLLTLRPHHSGEPKETRRLISTMLQHDLYHGGEINSIRGLYVWLTYWQFESWASAEDEGA